MMKGRSLLGLCLAVAVTCPAGCQELAPGDAGFGFSLAVTDYQIRDDVLNAVRHSGTSLALELFRRSGGEESRRAFGFSLLVNPLGDRYTEGRSSVVVHPAAEVRMAWKVADAGEQASVYLGGSAGWSTHFGFYEQWDAQHVYWLTATQAGVDLAVERRFGGGRSLHLEVGMPVVALVSRPPERFTYREVDHGLGWILGEIHRDARLATPSEHFALRAGLSYSAVREGKLRHSIFWRTSYVRNAAPTSREVRIVSHSLGVSMPWPF